MSNIGSDTSDGDGEPRRPWILIDDEAGRMNRGQPNAGRIAEQLPDWDLLPPDELLHRGGGR